VSGVVHDGVTRQGLLPLHHRKIITGYEDVRSRILWSRHGSPMGGHGGIWKGYDVPKRDYRWKGMKEDVLQYV